MNKTAIKNFAVWARRKLISDITYKAGMIGITENGIADPLPQSTGDLQFFDIGTKNYAEVSGIEIKQRNALVSAIKTKERSSNYKTAFQNVIEEVAYTWFNRLIAVRFMEVNDYLPSRVRVLSSENPAKNEPDFVTTPFDTDLEFSPYEQDRILQLKDENKLDELFRMLFIKQCNKFNEILPELFEKTEDFTELLLTISFADKDGVVYRLVHDISEDDFNVSKEGQVEIIGWMYQYYNIEPKAEIFSRAGGTKIKKEEIPAATQLFTPDWIVRYMVENSIGRIWHEGHSNSNILDNWAYYVKNAPQDEQLSNSIEKIERDYSNLSVESIKVIDPCMGSGHILVYAFDVLMQIYESIGYSQRDAARSILVNNLFGLDIDKRAYQLSYFAVMMKARQYNRRILTEGICPNLAYIRNSRQLQVSALEKLGDYKALAQRLINEFENAAEYGSIMHTSLSSDELHLIDEQINLICNEEEILNIMDMLDRDEILTYLKPVVKQAQILANKYEAVITNPPYLVLSNAGEKLTNYVLDNFPDSKADMFAVFMERCNQLLIKNGIQAMITMHSWMFLASFEQLRMKIQRQVILNMLHLGARAFEEIGGEVVQTTAFVIKKSSLPNYRGTYYRLISPTTQQGKEDMFLRNENIYIATQDSFEKIPGAPTAYWWGESVFDCFNDGKFIPGNPMKGIQTGKGEKYLRYWFEVCDEKTGLNMHSHSEMITSGLKWFPLTSGGLSRRWYGNFDLVVNLENDGADIRATGLKNFRLKDPKYYFQEGLTWTEVTTKPFTCRYLPSNVLFGNGGPVAFQLGDNLLYTIGLLNSVVAKEFFSVLAPTMNYGPDQVRNIPYKQIEKEQCEMIVRENIQLSKQDWDSFETSWDFVTHPFVAIKKDKGGLGHRLSDIYGLWVEICDNRFEKLRSNEEQLNRIFIKTYSLDDVLSPDVDEKDVSVRRADLQRDVKSLISYAVGCMFGRYSLDCSGLAFAGGDFNSSKYETFIPDKDNCIPITDEEYFDDDIVGRFVTFVKIVFGSDFLEENLDFIAQVLGNKGTTSRQVIRNYFLNDFIKDHIRTYQKKPIYWMFDSGKQNGFKALVYMHRWNADTVGNLRVEYLHRMQRVYEKEIERMQDTIEHTSGREQTSALKREEKLVKQLKEAKDYDAKIAHIALARIHINLDDGVKVNYDKVQTSTNNQRLEILTKL